MRWLTTWVLLCLAAGAVIAQENDAAQRFRQLEKRLQAAKSVQLRFDASITGADAKKWQLKGMLLLGAGDTLRMEGEGTLFGEESKFTLLSNGTEMKSFGSTKAPGQPKQEKNETEKSPKGLGTFFRAGLPRYGVFSCMNNMNRRSDRPPDSMLLSDFRLVGKEKIGKRNTEVIQYSVTIKGKGVTALTTKLWLDAQTELPVKLAMTGGRTDITDIAETYSEFTIDAKVDAKQFELPKNR